MSNSIRAGEGSNCLLVIRSVYGSLTQTEQKVADVVLKNANDVIFTSVTDLAAQAEVGETSVLRFCRKIGFRGYQEFKLTLAQDLVKTGANVHDAITEEDDLASLAKKVTAHNSHAVNDTLALLNVEELRKAVDAILGGHRIIFYGVGASGLSALDAMYKFVRIGLPVQAIHDPHIGAMTASLLTDRDVVVGISFSGSTKDTVDIIRLAKESGAYVICMTNYARSPIVKFADAVLLTASKENPLQGGALTSKIAQIHVLDILFTAVAVKHKEKALVATEKTAKAVLDKLY